MVGSFLRHRPWVDVCCVCPAAVLFGDLRIFSQREGSYSFQFLQDLVPFHVCCEKCTARISVELATVVGSTW